MGGNGNGPLEEGQMGVGDGKGTVVGDVDVVDIQDTSMEGLVESLKLRLVELQTKTKKKKKNGRNKKNCFSMLCKWGKIDCVILYALNPIS